MEHNIDYLIMHFIISVTIECLPSLAALRTCAAVPPFNEVDKEGAGVLYLPPPNHVPLQHHTNVAFQ